MKKGVVLISLLVVSFILLFCGCLLEPMHEHTFSSDWSSDANYHWHAATCEHTDEVKDKASHKWDSGTITTEATHTDDGVKTYTCTVCGQTKTEVIPAQADAHSFSTEWTSDETHHWHAATCEHADAKGSYEAHSWDDGEIITNATHTTDGEMKYTCTVCGQTKTEEIPAQADSHTFSKDWTSDETHHWHVATCEHDVVSEQAEHEFPFSWEKGLIDGNECVFRICEQCGYTQLYADYAKQFEGYFVVDDNGVLTVKTGITTLPSSIAIPEHVDGKVVQKVGTYAFSHRTELVEIMIPFTVSSIYRGAFGYSGLERVFIPSSVVSIGSESFAYCSSLSSILIPNTVTTIASNAFAHCTQLETVFLSDSLTSLSSGVFASCQNLSALEIPSSVTEIGISALANCTGIKKIQIPNSVTKIYDYAFNNWTDEQIIMINYGGFSGTTLTWNGCSASVQVSIPETTESIGLRAFYDCKGLTQIDIPSSIESINSYAFSMCTSLEDVYTPDLMSWCSILFAGTDANPLSFAENFYVGGELLEGSVIIPSGVSSIPVGAFCKRSGISSIVIPDSVETIGYGAFAGCTGLKEIQIPASVTIIGSEAFSNCSNLTSIILPNSVTDLGMFAFSGCISVSEITIPQSVETIGKNAFKGWNQNQTIFVNYGGFSGPTSKNDNGIWDLCQASVVVDFPNSTTIIGEGAFKNCMGLSEISLSSTIERIKEGAFWGCTSISSIIVPQSVKWIEANAFNGWNSTQTIQIEYGGFRGLPNGYSEGPWNNCNANMNISFTESATSIEGYAFYACKSLKEIEIVDTISSIQGSAFQGCSNLTNITIPSSVISINGYAFTGCSGLKEISYLDNKSSWELISKGEGGNQGIGINTPYTIHCTDGDIIVK